MKDSQIFLAILLVLLSIVIVIVVGVNYAREQNKQIYFECLKLQKQMTDESGKDAPNLFCRL